MTDRRPPRSTTREVPGATLIEHEFDLPLDHGDPASARLSVFAREVVGAEGADKPYLVFLQGGPGHESPRPTTRPYAPSWIERALRDFRVLLLDQRGTGLSSPVGTLRGWSAGEQTDYLVHFRADAIVRDCESIRDLLGVDRWSVLGQSFGGFCALHYLSTFPDSLREVLFTGGVPPVAMPVTEVYAATFAMVRRRNERYYDLFPEDRARVAAAVRLADTGELELPTGDRLTASRLRQVGQLLGMSDGAERLHALLERDPRSPAFGYDLADALPFSGRNPLYAVIHESCYADGGATRWAAEQAMPEDFRADPTLLTAEHVFRSSIAEDRNLRPLLEAADLLAEHDWPRLYDESVLRSVDVPAAAAVYTHDPYVLREHAVQTAALVPTLQVWESDTLEHNALRADGVNLLDRLLAMVRSRG